MMSDDPELEAYLRRFRPRAPAPLPRRTHRPRGTWLVAAALVLAALVWWGSGPRHTAPAPIPSMARASAGAASAALRQGSEAALLDELETRCLPDPTRQGGALRQLADLTTDLAEFSNGRSR